VITLEKRTGVLYLTAIKVNANVNEVRVLKVICVLCY